ncbi:hypothetical protein [Erwinia psidii]|uniref:Inner membrane protein yidI n=1 Tax=Erwinia psidii TaxID=69224 RepID=A0A3N6S042_9GAMM|nr:hypothetical protein [Erwinia psidii]RQM38878.1 hypothetical protein EB241_06695 [Erwinia psidii]
MMQNAWCSWAGMVMGGSALLLALTHFMVGPFSPRPPLETRVATKVVAIKNTTIAALQGKEVISAPLTPAWDSDRILSAAIAALATGAIILGISGRLLRHENSGAATLAVMLGIATVALQFAITALGVILLLILIAGIFSG